MGDMSPWSGTNGRVHEQGHEDGKLEGSPTAKQSGGHHCENLSAENEARASFTCVLPSETEARTPFTCLLLKDRKLPHIPLLRKVGAEMISTFILVFTGCGAAMVDANSHGAVTHVGVSLAFGIVVMIMIYAVGHISGAHMNPAVTVAFATVRHFPWKEVPLYIGAQVVASICASFSLRLTFGDVANIGATLPAGSNLQSFILEIIITAILMFVVSAVATDTRAVGELAGIAVGSTVALNALFAGPISGASMNPARSLGPAIAANNYRSFWIYVIGPGLGALGGAWGYNLIRGSAPTLAEVETVKRSTSFASSSSRRASLPI